MSGKLLLHACCAPCATVTVDEYRRAGYEPVLFFHNPNIHPFREFRRRLETLESWAAAQDLELIVHHDYPLEENVRLLLSSDPRCRSCFLERLSATARAGAEMGFQCFGTTLSVSPYQCQELIMQAGREAQDRHGLEFAYIDCRRLYPDSVRMSREQGIYRQPYCGCVFSERDRYSGKPGPRGQAGIDTVREKG